MGASALSTGNVYAGRSPSVALASVTSSVRASLSAFAGYGCNVPMLLARGATFTSPTMRMLVQFSEPPQLGNWEQEILADSGPTIGSLAGPWPRLPPSF